MILTQLKVKGWKRVYLWLFLTIPFLLFIMEEGVQTLGFGRFTLAQGKLWAEALEAVNADRKINAICFMVSVACFPFNPLAGSVFTLYFWADRQKILREVVRYETELWGYSNQTVGSRKLALLVIGITLVLMIALHFKTRRKPAGRKDKFTWNETELREAARKFGIDDEKLMEFFTDNEIPTSGKGKE